MSEQHFTLTVYNDPSVTPQDLVATLADHWHVGARFRVARAKTGGGAFQHTLLIAWMIQAMQAAARSYRFKDTDLAALEKAFLCQIEPGDAMSALQRGELA